MLKLENMHNHHLVIKPTQKNILELLYGFDADNISSFHQINLLQECSCWSMILIFFFFFFGGGGCF